MNTEEIFFAISLVFLAVVLMIIFIKYIRLRQRIPGSEKTVGTVTDCEKKSEYRGTATYLITYECMGRTGSFNLTKPIEKGSSIEVYLFADGSGGMATELQMRNMERSIALLWILLPIFACVFAAMVGPKMSRVNTARSEFVTEETMKELENRYDLSFGSSTADWEGDKYIALCNTETGEAEGVLNVSITPAVELFGAFNRIDWTPERLQYTWEQGNSYSYDDIQLTFKIVRDPDGINAGMYKNDYHYSGAEETEWKCGGKIIKNAINYREDSFPEGAWAYCYMLSGDVLLSSEFKWESVSEHYDLNEEETVKCIEEMLREIWTRAEFRVKDFEKVTAAGPFAKREIRSVNGSTAYVAGTGTWTVSGMENLAVSKTCVQPFVICPAVMINKFLDVWNEKFYASDSNTEELDDLVVDGRIITWSRKCGVKVVDEVHRRTRSGKKYVDRVKLKAVEYTAYTQLGQDIAAVSLIALDTDKIENAEQLIREIFSEENLILEEKITEELVIRDTVPDLPEEIRGVGAETADMDGDKYILNLRADGSLAGAAVLPSPIDFLTGSINEVIWDRSSVKYDVRGGQGDSGHYTFQVCFSKDPYGKGYLYEEEISAASTFLSGDREFFYYYEEGAYPNIYVWTEAEEKWFSLEVVLFDSPGKKMSEEDIRALLEKYCSQIDFPRDNYETISAAGFMARRRLEKEDRISGEITVVYVPGGGESSWKISDIGKTVIRNGYPVKTELVEAGQQDIEKLADSYEWRAETVEKGPVQTVQIGEYAVRYMLVCGISGSGTDGRFYCDCLCRIALPPEKNTDVSADISRKPEIQLIISTLGMLHMDNVEELLRDYVSRISWNC